MGKEQDAHNRRTFWLSFVALVASVSLGLGNLEYQIHRDNSNRRSTEKRFSNIETVLRLLTAATAPQMQKAVDDSLQTALAEPSKAKESIEYAGAIIRQFRNANVSIPESDLTKTGSQLATLLGARGNLPQAWNTAGEFISYRSQSSVADLSYLKTSGLPDCTDRPAHPMKIQTMNEARTKMTVSSEYFSDCRITLDSPKDQTVINGILLTGESFALAFKNCLIVYRGGNINLITALADHPITIFTDNPEHGLLTHVEVKQTLFFEQCLFDMELNGEPSQFGQQFTQELVALNSPYFALSRQDSATN
jgi:hypothetical protein